LAPLMAAAAALWLAPAAHTAEAAPIAIVTTMDRQMAALVTADFQAVEFAAAMDFLADSAGVNIILSEGAREVAKPVTVHMMDMPLKRALEYLLRGQNLLFRTDGTAIWVATREEMEAEPLETRVFLLRQGPGMYAAFESMAETRESVALQATGLQSVRTIRDVIAEVIPMIGASSLMLDERSGSLIVTHVPYYLQTIEGLLAKLDVTPLQVIIEARFVEITQQDTLELGVDAQLTGDAALTKQSQSDGTTSPGLQLSQTGTLARGTKTAFTDFANQAAGNGLNLTLQGVLTGMQYSAVLHALAENERTKTLSAPRVTTLNNQTATIKIVTEFVYATRFEASVQRTDFNGDGDFIDVASDGTRETQFVNVPQDFVTKDLGILLHVTPSIGQDLKTITLALKPEVSEKKTDDSYGGEVTLPRFTTRNLETSVVVENGETIVLGGLMKDTTVDTITRIPVLGSIPYLGGLFRKTSLDTERSNLLIFVTAQLLESSGASLAGAPAGTP